MVRIIGNYSYQIHVHKCPVECGVSRGTPIAKGTNRIHKERIQCLLHMAGHALSTQENSDTARARLRSARLVRCSSQKAASATCERARADKKRNRKRAAVVAPCWRTGVVYILVKYALSHRQLCKNSSFELHAPARRSAAQRRGRCCWRHLMARSGCDRRPYPEGI